MLVLSAKKIAVNYTLLKLAKLMAQKCHLVLLLYTEGFWSTQWLRGDAQVQIITSPRTVLTVGMVFGFLQMWCCVLWPNIFNLVSSVKKQITLQVLWFYQMLLYKPKQCCHVYCIREAFSWQPSQPSCACSVFFLLVLSLILTFEHSFIQSLSVGDLNVV